MPSVALQYLGSGSNAAISNQPPGESPCTTVWSPTLQLLSVVVSCSDPDTRVMILDNAPADLCPAMDTVL